MAKTKAQNTRNQQNHRDRVKAKFEAVIADILDDVVVYPERKDDGKLYITWDMSPETHAKLTLVAEAKGTNLDAILGGLVKHRLKLQELKEKHDGGASNGESSEAAHHRARAHRTAGSLTRDPGPLVQAPGLPEACPHRPQLAALAGRGRASVDRCSISVARPWRL